MIDPVTVAVTFRVKAGRDAEFERWARDITDVALKYPGNLGASWMRSGPTYQVVYRFADHPMFNAWHESAERAIFLERLRPLATLVTDDHATGMETWFQMPEQPGRPAPPRWKMVVTTWIGVFPVLGLLQWVLGSRLTSWPHGDERGAMTRFKSGRGRHIAKWPAVTADLMSCKLRVGLNRRF